MAEPIVAALIASADGTHPGCVSDGDIDAWISHLTESVAVDISLIPLAECDPWFYDRDEGMIRNTQGSFFQIAGIRRTLKNGVQQQPIIIQNEVGCLGILAKNIDGCMHFLMQAKIEPGNLNGVQISPTVQATVSNFQRKHGGSAPPYLDYFKLDDRSKVIVDKTQPEQAERFYGKSNRNVIVLTEDEVEVGPAHCWMTLTQIARLMRRDNLVNMDTRSVLSCIPWTLLHGESAGAFDTALFHQTTEVLSRLTQRASLASGDRKSLVALDSLPDWRMKDCEVVDASGLAPFKVVFGRISIEGREVTCWNQPLVASLGPALYLQVVRRRGSRLQLLVRFDCPIGCFNHAEITTTAHVPYRGVPADDVQSRAVSLLNEGGAQVLHDVMLSEEGGRFYHEENRNVIVQVDDEFPDSDLPEDYHWCDYATLNTLIGLSGCVAIQLRTLLSLLERPYEFV